ncbi:MAG: septum formation initiator family protein [Clostridium sp.]|nr:septum formation initiator family protein [Clostridium sp.]
MRKISFRKVVICFIGIYVCFIVVSQQMTLSRQNKDINEYTSQLQQAEKKNQKLQDEIKLSKDDSYIEKLAREKLGLIREGEYPVIDSK